MSLLTVATLFGGTIFRPRHAKRKSKVLEQCSSSRNSLNSLTPSLSSSNKLRSCAHFKYCGVLFSVKGGELAALPSGSKPKGAFTSSQPSNFGLERLTTLVTQFLSRLERRGVAAGEFSLLWDFPEEWLLLEMWLLWDPLLRVEVPPFDWSSFSSPGTGGLGAVSVKFPPESLRNLCTSMLILKAELDSRHWMKCCKGRCLGLEILSLQSHYMPLPMTCK